MTSVEVLLRAGSGGGATGSGVVRKRDFTGGGGPGGTVYALFVLTAAVQTRVGDLVLLLKVLLV